MRILYHHRTLADGAEGIHIAEMVRAFRGLGHEVHVCGLAESNGTMAPHGIAHRLKSRLPSSAFELASVGSNVVEYLDIRRSIRRIRPDFMYKRHARFDVGAIRAARDERVPLVLEVNCLFAGPGYHAFEPMTLGAVAARLERAALESSDVVLAVSTPLARDIESMASVRATVMPNGADPERFDPARANPGRIRAHHGLGGSLIIGWAGVIREWHGLELLIDAMASLPDARLLIVGDGPERPGIERRAAALGIGDRVVITGRVAHDEMPDYVAAMDIAVVASDGTGVASPMKLLEYMAMGRPVVAPCLDNIRDLVTDGVDGVLFTPGDGAGLADVLRRHAEDASARQRLGQAARTTVQRTRNWRCNAEQVLSLVRARGIARPARWNGPPLEKHHV